MENPPLKVLRCRGVQATRMRLLLKYTLENEGPNEGPTILDGSKLLVLTARMGRPRRPSTWRSPQTLAVRRAGTLVLKCRLVTALTKGTLPLRGVKAWAAPL